MLHYPHIDPILFSLGPLRVHWYGVTYLVAFGAAWSLARLRARAPGSTWTAEQVDDFVFYAMLGTILGGRIGYVLFYATKLQWWLDDPLYPIKVWDGGMSFHGGFLGVMTAIAVFARRTGKRIWDVFDFAAPLPGLGIFAVRIGNFINGELWGRPTDAWYGFGARDALGNEMGVRHASQLYEATLEGLVLFTVVWLYTRRPRPRYAASAAFLVLYSLARITVEFVRVPDAQLGYLYLDWVTMGQLLSLPMLLAGLFLAWRAGAHPEPSGNRGA